MGRMLAELWVARNNRLVEREDQRNDESAGERIGQQFT
jgi:hypothetical protein